MEIPTSSGLPDQQELWDRKHGAAEHEALRAKHTPFADVAREYFPERADILEIGCGVGSDASFFAQNGYNVLAADLSSVVIGQAKEHFHQEGLEFEQLDVSQRPLPFSDKQFDVIYSHLALHYYDDETTRSIFAELHRILKESGVLAFACKSPQDPHYGQGEEIEKDMFLAKGHLRHFLSTPYVDELLEDKFDVKLLQDKEDTYNNSLSAFVWCIATKRTE